MKRLFFFGMLAVLFISCQHTDRHLISYTISPIHENGSDQLSILLKCPAEADGETILLFQDQAWGQDSLQNVIASMKLLNAEATITVQRDSGWVLVKHPKNIQTLDFQYELEQDSEGTLTTQNSYRPIIRADYFHLFGHNMFMLPKEMLEVSEDTFDVALNWKGFPENYHIQNSFGSQERVQRIEHISEEKFHTSAFVGGDFRIHKINIKNNEVAFAIRGDWEVFDDSEMLSILEQTMITQRDFYQDHSQDYFSVTMIPVEQERGSSFQGTGLTNSFALSASNNTNLEVEGLVYLLNHELQHNWIGAAIKNDDEEKQYWFSEGFTDYYTLKNIASEKIHELDGSYFISEFNEFVKALFTSPVKNLANEELDYEKFWSSPDIGKLPYRRGAVFAFYLDQKIQKETAGKKSLDNVMFLLKDAAELNGQNLTHKHFIATVNKVSSYDVTDDFNRFIEQGHLIDLAMLYTNLGLDFEPTSDAFDLGFTFSEDRKSVASINEESNAYTAGMREGDLLTSISHYNSEKYPAEFTMLRDGAELSVSYTPVKTAKIPSLKDSEHNKKGLGF